MRHYLDHASSSPLRPEARAAFDEWLSADLFVDPGRPYSEGRSLSHLIEQSRELVAGLVSARPRQVIFTSSGTEAANLATHSARLRASRDATVVYSNVEHASVRLYSEASGRVEVVPVDSVGRVELESIRALVDREPVPTLVHCQLANHEVGTLQPVDQVIEICHERGVAVHVDACMANGHVRIDATELNADYLSLSAHKFGGPPGIGALVVAPRIRVSPLLRGGDQERARRAGIENAGAILAFGAACEVLSMDGAIERASAHERHLTEDLMMAARSVSGVTPFGDIEDRVPHIVCVGVEGVEAEGVVLGLDQRGVSVHSGSSCSSESFEPSPVLEAMGVDSQHSLRLSVGWSSTQSDVEAFALHFPIVVDSLRGLRS